MTRDVTGFTHGVDVLPAKHGFFNLFIFSFHSSGPPYGSLSRSSDHPRCFD